MTLRTMPLPLRILATCLLMTIGMAYVFAVAYLYLMDFEPHRQSGLGVLQTVIVKYYGQRQTTQLETALLGSMGRQLPVSEKQQIIQWLREGAQEAEFMNILPLLQQACGSCHGASSGGQKPPLSSYVEVSKYAASDFGESVRTLVRVSHIHLFGISFIFALTGLVFAFSRTPVLFRSVLIALPFCAMWLDVASWWLTKYAPAFAATVIIGGVLMGLSLAGQIAVSLYEMWGSPPTD